MPGRVPAPAVTEIGPGPVQGRPVRAFLPNGVDSIVVLGAGEIGTGGSWVTVFPLSIGLVVFPLLHRIASILILRERNRKSCR